MYMITAQTGLTPHREEGMVTGCISRARVRTRATKPRARRRVVFVYALQAVGGTSKMEMVLSRMFMLSVLLTALCSPPCRAVSKSAFRHAGMISAIIVLVHCTAIVEAVPF